MAGGGSKRGMCEKEEGEGSRNAHRRARVESKGISELLLGGEDSDFPVSMSPPRPPGVLPEPHQGAVGLPSLTKVQWACQGSPLCRGLHDTDVCILLLLGPLAPRSCPGHCLAPAAGCVPMQVGITPGSCWSCLERVRSAVPLFQAPAASGGENNPGEMESKGMKVKRRELKCFKGSQPAGCTCWGGGSEAGSVTPPKDKSGSCGCLSRDRRRGNKKAECPLEIWRQCVSC